VKILQEKARLLEERLGLSILLKRIADLDVTSDRGVTVHPAVLTTKVAEVLEELRPYCKPGVPTRDLDRVAEEATLKRNALPAFKGYRGFPKALCASINAEVVHGIPGEQQLREGDIVGLDYGVLYSGYYGDAAITVPVGPETLGRLFNVLGEPIDEKGPVHTKSKKPIHCKPPAFKEQSTQVEILETGIKVIDLIAPIVKGGKVSAPGIFPIKMAQLDPQDRRLHLIDVLEFVHENVVELASQLTGDAACFVTKYIERESLQIGKVYDARSRLAA
jgi:hypothetical protein